MTVQVLVVRPKTLNAADKALLRKSGVVCVEADDPQSVRMLAAEGPPLGGNDLFRAAMLAIGEVGGRDTVAAFAKNMAAMAKAAGGLVPDKKAQP